MAAPGGSGARARLEAIGAIGPRRFTGTCPKGSKGFTKIGGFKTQADMKLLTSWAASEGPSKEASAEWIWETKKSSKIFQSFPQTNPDHPKITGSRAMFGQVPSIGGLESPTKGGWRRPWSPVGHDAGSIQQLRLVCYVYLCVLCTSILR